MPEDVSCFVEVFGDSPLIRVLDFLLCEGKYFDYSLTDIAENSGVAWSTLHEVFPKLIKLGVVKQTRQIARAKLYKLNTQSPLVKELMQIDMKISKHFADKAVEKLAVKA